MAAKGVRPLRVISGGQTGADQGGLLAARELGIATGGTAPQGWTTETGADEQLLRGFGLIECIEPGYDARTRKNVLEADGTMLVGSYATGGSALTAAIAAEARKPFFHVPFPATTKGRDVEDHSRKVQQWLDHFQIRVLNIAGNRESQNPGIQEFTRRFLVLSLGTSMSNATCRAARLEDAGLIVDFQIAMAEETEQIRLDREVCSQGVKAVLNDAKLGRYFVAEIGGSVVASTLITYEWSDWRNGLVWWIQSVYVVPAARRQGVYGGLYRYLQELAKGDPDVRGIRLYVDRRNEAAKEVYTRLGMNGEHYQVFEWMKEF